MNNFEALSQYMIPSNILIKMLEVYKNIGQNKYLDDALGDAKYYLTEQNVERETFIIASLLELNISDNRMRLIITKNSNPTNQEEKVLLGIKEVLKIIQKDAPEHTFNGSDILGYLNRIFGKNSHKFNNKNYDELLGIRNKLAKPVSMRLSYEKMLENYHFNFSKETFEKIYLSVTAYLEMDLMKPYSDHNELASLLALYYMLIRTNVNVFYYIGFFEKYLRNKDIWNSEKRLSFINFPTSHLQLNGLINLIFDMIINSYLELESIIREKNFDKRMYKGDGIEQTIARLPSTFSKEDIRVYHPDVSDSTINRALFRLRDEKYIMPLGKGRSARWVKLVKDDNPKNIFGYNYDNDENEK
mgnify:CR=1 FL=1